MNLNRRKRREQRGRNLGLKNRFTEAHLAGESTNRCKSYQFHSGLGKMKHAVEDNRAPERGRPRPRSSSFCRVNGIIHFLLPLFSPVNSLSFLGLTGPQIKSAASPVGFSFDGHRPPLHWGRLATDFPSYGLCTLSRRKPAGARWGSTV